ncbi:hypothetical protein RFEPED_0245 [Rickettsia felis str. Pedreira]|uniref:Uncharacterized protein n=1 Tax=Rickettsia felis str. Pedreira TaxID=1359196 RepID=A0A0F3MQD7_RICFI|nr:hypothetical protein RFEPED_0245 [Rickettsia felis str. Pedreira]
MKILTKQSQEFILFHEIASSMPMASPRNDDFRAILFLTHRTQ